VPQDQVLRPGLKGGERVVLKNLHPRLEMLDFEIPKLAFSARFHIKERTQEIAMVADTLLIEPDEERFSITFRASCPIDDGREVPEERLDRPRGIQAMKAARNSADHWQASPGTHCGHCGGAFGRGGVLS